MEGNNSNSKSNSSRNSGGGSSGIGEGIYMLAAAAIAFMVFLLLVYSIVLGLSAGAIYLGAMLGSNGQLGKKTRPQKVKDLEAEKQENINELEGESDDLKELVASSFENEKMNLYRPEEDRPEPLLNINIDAVKTVVKRVAKTVVEKTR